MVCWRDGVRGIAVLENNRVVKCVVQQKRVRGQEPGPFGKMRWLLIEASRGDYFSYLEAGCT